MSLTTTTNMLKAYSQCKTLLAAVALGSAALAAQAQVQTVFNAYQDINGDILSPPVSSYNCFVCSGTQNLTEIGDVITLGGTQRVLDSATVLLGQFPVPGNLFAPYQANVTFNVYSVSNIGPNPTVTLLGSRTQQANITANNSIYDIPFDFTGLNIVMPNTIYYGVSVTSASPLGAGLRMGLFDYLDPLNYGNGLVNVPAGTLQQGIDPGTVVTGVSPLTISSVMYARTAANPGQVVQTQPGVVGGGGINTGYTGAVFITAVPEPETYALMLLGVAGVLAFTAKRRKV